MSKPYFFILVFLVILLLFFYNQSEHLRFYINFEKIQEIEQNKKYIEYECSDADTCGGWGDRLKGLLSTYGYAQILNRKFLIKMTKNCDLLNLLKPNEVDWDYRQIDKDRANMSRENFHIHWNYNVMESFKTIDILNQTTKADLLNVKTGIMYADSFSQNKFLQDRLKELGYESNKFTIFYQIRNWYKKLFKLNDDLQEKYEMYMKKLRPRKESKIICTQIRQGDPGHPGESEPDVAKNFGIL